LGKGWVWAAAAAGAATLIYGALVESKRLVLERKTLRLPKWPALLDGYRIALLADFHLRDIYSLELTHRAVEMALEERPDIVVIAGDFVGYWKPESAALLGAALEPLQTMAGRIVAIPGNHDYWLGDPRFLAPVTDLYGIKLLRNEVWRHDGIAWVGIDSLNANRANPFEPMMELGDEPAVALWHEPDAVRHLPDGAALMLSGHSHGSQFIFPGGFAPMHTKNGKRFTSGFYPNARTPLYVSRGIGTTGPPSRFLCPPEVSILTLASR
jgi:predicted MPP superfamily phosphohydrolase